MKKRPEPSDNRSIKTFFIYTALVLIAIIISLLIKALMIIQQDKYHGEHFTVSIAQNHIVKEVVTFNPDTLSLALLKINSSTIKTSQLGEKLAVMTDGQIDVNGTLPLGDDVTQTLFFCVLHYKSIQKNITIFDVGQLLLLSRNIPPNNQIIKELSDSEIPKTEDYQFDKIISSLFTDDIISSENTSIQIVNASEVSGMGKRLERVLVNMGANVVSVVTSKEGESQSKIQYFGKRTYTAGKFVQLLQYPESILPKETIADVVIIIGKDSADTSKF